METVSGMNTLSYLGVNAPNPPNIIPALRAPTANDKKYNIGDMWINTSTSTSYQLVDIDGSGADWQIVGSPTGAVSGLSGDTGTAAPAAGIIAIAGGTNLTSAASGSTVTMNLDAVVAGLTSVAATTFTTNVAAAQLSLSGTTISTIGTDANIDLNLATKGTGSLLMSRSAAGVDLNMQITNSDNTAAAGSAGLQLAVGGSTSTGDPYISFQVSGVGASTMTMGLDNSASDLFVISNSTTLGTSNALTLSQAGALNATTSITAGTSLTATLGDITATNGNIVRGTAGNKDVYSSVASTTTAGANSAGTVTLVGGTATVSTTAVTASSIVRLYRQGVGATGAAALGYLTLGTVVASTSFVINAVQAADATALQASDVSVIAWEIVN